MADARTESSDLVAAGQECGLAAVASAAYRVVLVLGPPHGRSLKIVVAVLGGLTAW